MAETSFPISGGAGVTDYPYETLMATTMGIGRVHPTLDYITAITDLVYGDSTGRQVKVTANSAYIVRGFRWESGTDVNVLALGANTSGKTRIDRVVLRLDRSTYTVRLAVLPGTPADAPTPPSVTQNSGASGVFEVPIAQVKVTSNSGSGLPSIVATDVTPEYRWLASNNHIGTEAARPSKIGLGELYYATDTGRLYAGVLGKDILIAENGPNTKLAVAGGWSLDSIYAQRVNGWTDFRAYANLNVADRPASTDLLLCTLPTEFRPQNDRWFNCVMSPGQGAFGYITASTGTVKITAYPQVFPQNGKVVIGPLQWPSTGVAS